MKRSNEYFLHVLLLVIIYIIANCYSSEPTITPGDPPQYSTTDIDILAPVALPLDNACSNLCADAHGSDVGILKYKENEVYRYKIEGLTTIHLPNSLKGETNQLNFVANFDISPENKCSFLLRVSNVEIIGPDGKKHAGRLLTGFPARFSWFKGQLAKVCFDKEESTAAANLKRSILSNMQTSIRSSSIEPSFHETDVYGACPTSVEATQEQDGSWLIKKSKDLNKCAFREGFDFAVKSMSYQSNNPLKTNPFVQANLKSITKIEKGIIRTVEVTEEYEYQPMTIYTGTRTSVRVTTKVVLLGKSKTGFGVGSLNPAPSTVLFETVKTSSGDVSVPTITGAIQDASEEDESGVIPPNAANEFSKLVGVLQDARKSEILTAYAQIKSGAGLKYKDSARIVFWHGIISAGTAATVETAATLLVNKEMPDDTISKFLSSLSFVKHPTKDTLSAVAPLLDESNIPAERYLAIGALVRKYVMDHPKTQSAELNSLVEKLTQPIRNNCVSRTKEEEDLIIASLKGLRNAGYMTKKELSKVENCALKKEVSTRTRVAALQALMVESSNEMVSRLASEIFEKKHEDSELRIWAFLVHVNSPTNVKATTIKNWIDAEESDQVGSYIVSYLRNLRSSTNPEKEIQKRYYGNIKSKKRFPIDFRQYSQNYELSQLLSAFNLGYSAEADVIFSSSSYVPKSTSLGLNSYLFGNAFNLFKLDARFDNVEYLVEKMIGPRSYLQMNTAEDIADDLVNNSRSFVDLIAKKASMFSRAKREMKDTVKKSRKKKASLSDDFLDVDLSVKMFDSEVNWMKYHVNKNNLASGQYLDELYKAIEDAIKNARNIDIDWKRYTRSPILSNSIIYYPTSMGFPLKLSTDINSVINFKMNGNVDAVKIIKRPEIADIRLNIKPSAVIQVDGKLEIDASIISAGLKASSSVRSATNVDLNFKILDGHGCEMKIGFPTKEQDIFTLKSEAFTTIQERGLPSVDTLLQPAGKRYEYGGDFDQLNGMLGLSLFAEVNSPAFSYRPTVIPGKFSIRLVKQDELLKYYYIKALYNNKESGRCVLELMFDTPGTTVNRQISLLADANLSDKKVVVEFKSPVKDIYLEGYVVNEKKEVACHAKFKIDTNEYGLKIGATVNNEKYKTIYRPFVELSSPNDARDTSISKMRIKPRQQAASFNVDGQIILEKKKGSLSYRKYDFKELAVTLPIGKFTVDGPVFIDREIPQFGSDIAITYGNGNKIEWKSDLNYVKNKSEEEQTTGSFALMPSQWPDYGFKLEFDLLKTPHLEERTISFTHGLDFESKVSKMTVKDTMRVHKDPKNNKIIAVDFSLKASYPLWKFDGSVTLSNKILSNYSVYCVLNLDSTNVEINSSLDFANKKSNNDVFKLQTKLNEKKLIVNAVRESTGEDTSKVTIYLSTTPGKEITAVVLLTHIFRIDNYVLRAESTLNVSPGDNVYNYDMGVKYTPNEKSILFVTIPNNEKNLELKAGYITNLPSWKAYVVVFARNSIDGSATYEFENSKVNGDLRIDILKLKRLITGKVDLKIVDDRIYTGDVELLWDVSKDPSKNIKIETKTEISNASPSLKTRSGTDVANESRSITTENKIQFLEYSFQVNGNCSMTGEPSNGDLTADIEVTAPKGSRIVTNIRRYKRTSDSALNYDLNVDGYYYKPNTKTPIKVGYKLAGKDLDATNIIFDVNSELTVHISKTKNVKMGLGAKRKLSDGKWDSGGNILVDGSLVKKKLNLTLGTIYSCFSSYKDGNLSSSYQLYGNLGNDYVIDSKGKIVRFEIENDITMKFPARNESLNATWVTKTHFDVLQNDINVRTENNFTWNNNKYAIFNNYFELYPKTGNVSMNYESSDVSKRSLEFNYAYGTENLNGLLKGPFAEVLTKLTLNEKVASGLLKVEYSDDFTTKKITFEGSSPKSGKFDVQLTNKILDDGQSLFNDLALNTVENAWYASSRIDTYTKKPAIDLLYRSPEGESTFVLKFEEKSEHYWRSAMNASWKHGGDGYIKARSDLKLDNVDDLLVKFTLDAPVFEIDNFTLAAATKLLEEDKRKLIFTAKLANSGLLSGSASYSYHKDDTKLIFEGSGSAKIENKNYPVTFKYTKLILTDAVNGEEGTLSKFYVNFDNKKHVLDLEGKFTNKNILLKRDYCRGDKCYKLDVSYEIKMIDALNYETKTLAHIDLKPFIQNGEEFIIEGKTVKSLSQFDHRMSLQWAPQKKIEYTVYSTNGKSGVSFTLPQRQLAAEAIYSYKWKARDGTVKLLGNVWFDKLRDENLKLMLSLGAEYKVPEDQSFVMRSSAGIQIPTLPKNLTISSGVQLSLYDEKAVDITTELDIFKNSSQTIVITYQVYKERNVDSYKISDVLQITSEGQNLDTRFERSSVGYLDHLEYHFMVSYLDYNNNKKVSTADLEIRLLSLDAKVNIFEKYLIGGKTSIGFGRNYIEFKEEVHILGHGYVKICRFTTDPRIVIGIEWKGMVEQKALINASLVWNKFFNVIVYLNNDNGTVISFTLMLDDENFMKSETKLNIDNTAKLLENTEKDILALINDTKTSTKSVINDVNAQFKHRIKQYRKAVVDVKPIVNSANEYIASMRDEIKNDPSIASASHNVKQLINNFSDFIMVVLQHLSAFLGDWIYVYNGLIEKMYEFADSFVTNINNIVQNTIDDISVWLREVADDAKKNIMNIIEYIKTNKDKWKEAIVSAFDTARDSLNVIRETIEQLKKDVKEFVEKLQQYIESFPLTNYLKERFDQIKNSKIPQYVYSMLYEYGQNLKETMPTSELRDLIDTLLSTLNKILNDKPYDTATELRNIYNDLVNSTRSIIFAIKNSDYVQELANSDYSLPQLSWSSFKNIPNLWSTAYNAFNWVRNLDFRAFEDILYTYKPGTMNPLTLIPPFKKVGVIVDGQHVITMNGNYYTMNGNCQYLLAGDFENYNFTVVADVKNGKMKSLALSSSTQTIELFADSAPTLNKAVTDFPIYGDNVYAIRNPYSIHVHIDNSVLVTCSPQLDVCTIQISGFYQNQVYGLLGTVSADRSIDFMMPNMEVAKDAATFVKSYGIDSKCKELPVPDTSNVEAAEECSNMFNGKSIFRRGFSFVNTKVYRDMCDQAVSLRTTPAKRQETACKLGLAFSLVSYANGFYLSLPPECGQCIVDKNSLAYGASTRVIVPSQSADIVILLEEVENTKKIFTDLWIKSMEKLKNELKLKSITDINFVLIGYGPEDWHPSLHTTNGEITFNEKTNVVFSSAEDKIPSSDLGKFVKNVKLIFGNMSQRLYGARKALQVANDYPYRPDALKAVVHIKAQDGSSSSFDIYNSLVNTLIAWNIVNDKIPVFAISPLNSVEPITAESEEEFANIFGFDLTTMYTAEGPKSFENGLTSRLHLLEMYKAAVILPLTTDGAAFNSSVFAKSSADVRSKLTNVFSQAVLNKLINYERSFDCFCTYKCGIYAEPKCTLIQTRSLIAAK